VGEQDVVIAMAHGLDGAVGAVKGVERTGEGVAHTVLVPRGFDDLLAAELSEMPPAPAEDHDQDLAAAARRAASRSECSKASEN